MLMKLTDSPHESDASWPIYSLHISIVSFFHLGIYKNSDLINYLDRGHNILW